ncbi:MAG: alpha/beta hydrolase [Rudaea sp.]|uniref:alpha/beta fold hydrolase n=2 Tax=unclassified Rudaea TaxID=2627037 RepID=UPI0010F4786C|nr:alpha/beta hydrolase [Rudaea sp.]MBR0346786.1 alpha/beta hydrolase [Rudaea sp.]
MMMETLDSFADVPGGRVFLRRWVGEDARRAPIVLLHDSLGCVELWRDFPAALAAATRREVIVYDRLGFGRSTPSMQAASVRFIDDEAEVFFPALRKALGLARFVLFGHSVGGAMALATAANCGDGCEAVVTESAQAFVEQRTLDGIRAAKAQFADAAQFAKLTKWHGDKARWVLDAWTEVWLSPEFSSWNLDAQLARVRCPVLAIHGDADEYGSEAFPRRIVDGVGGASTLAILDRCGHVPHREQTDEVLRLSASFLADVD